MTQNLNFVRRISILETKFFPQASKAIFSFIYFWDSFQEL